MLVCKRWPAHGVVRSSEISVGLMPSPILSTTCPSCLYPTHLIHFPIIVIIIMIVILIISLVILTIRNIFSSSWSSSSSPLGLIKMMIKMTWVSSSLLSAHPQNCHLTGVIGEGGGRTDRLLSKTCFSSNSVLDRKIMIWHWPPGLLSIFLKELPSKKVVIFPWTRRMPKAVVFKLFLGCREQLTQGSVFPSQK